MCLWMVVLVKLCLVALKRSPSERAIIAPSFLLDTVAVYKVQSYNQLLSCQIPMSPISCLRRLHCVPLCSSPTEMSLHRILKLSPN